MILQCRTNAEYHFIHLSWFGNALHIPDQSYDRLLFVTDMKMAKQVLPFMAGLEVSRQGNAALLQFAFLQRQHLIAQCHGRIGVSLLPGCVVEFDGCRDSERESLQFVGCAIHFGKWSRGFQAFCRIPPMK
jgi:hypothetical protein